MPKHFYPALILFLLGGFLTFSGWSAYRAVTQVSQITDPDYYSKGLKYNSSLVEKRAASVLGWQLSTRLNKFSLQLRLSDKVGAPVSGARGQLIFGHQQTDLNALSLKETSPGLYVTDLPATLKGELSIRVDFVLQGARLNRQLLLNI
jgi:nitrogen fixation protein FixH